MRRVTMASVFGFCKGVENSVALAEKLIAEHPGERLYTTGDLIHNRAVVEDLRARGVESISGPEGHEKGIALVRAHGITPDEYRRYKEAGFGIVDGTCRLVRRNQRLIAESRKPTLFIGKKGHPETISTMAHSTMPCMLISSVSDLDRLRKEVGYNAVIQTTASQELVSAVKEEIVRQGFNVSFLTDVCNSSARRREAVRKLCTSCDTIVVVGDVHSANSQALRALAEKEGRRAFLIQDVSDITPEILESDNIGLTAGASVPMNVIKNVRRFLKYGENSGTADTDG